jgi:hypothetical protein
MKDPNSGRKPRGLFVLGAPRSGTTLVGNFLGSAVETLNLAEYGGFHLAYNIARSGLGAMPGPYREAYLADLRTHAAWFAEGLAEAQGKEWYCDSTPWNLAAMHAIAADLPDALFVVMLRHYAGCIQSLRRSAASGFGWAGRDWAESAEVWAHSYRSAIDLPADRTLVVSYDALAAYPESTIDLLCSAINGLGYGTTDLDLGELVVSHAPPSSGSRPTIGVRENESVRLQPIPSFATEHWSGDIHRMVWPVVKDVHKSLLERYPSVYFSPPPPRQSWVHHDVEGLVPAEVGDNW